MEKSSRRDIERALRLHNEGRLDDAAARYLDVLGRDPGNADALHLLGVLRSQQGQHRAAEALIGEALAARAAWPEAHFNLGNAQLALGNAEAAATSFKRALELKPDNPHAHYNLGSALLTLERFGAAAASYERAVAALPGFAEAHMGLGVALGQLGRLDEAVQSIRRAVALQPAYASAHKYLGLTLRDLNRPGEAAAHLQRAAELEPGDAATLNDLGAALRMANRREEAAARFREAIGLDNNHAAARDNLGIVLGEMGRHAEAIAVLREAVNLSPDRAETWNNLGASLMEAKHYGEAIESLRRATALAPDHPRALANLVHARRIVCDWRDADADEAELIARVREGRGLDAPFAFLTIAGEPADHLACASHYLRQRVPAKLPPLRPDTPYAHQRIRLGYLSADFREHAVMQLIAELFELHDRGAFEVFGFSIGPPDQSPMRKRLERAFDHFVDLHAVDDEAAAQTIRSNEIDILVDLQGYTRAERVGIVARKPAPAQVSHIGYVGTMAADFIDYIIVDPFVVPAGQQRWFTEKLVQLPDCYLLYDRTRAIAEPAPKRAEYGLPEGGFVFCCFNNNAKITPAFFDIWMRLLGAVPGSVLWLLEDHALVPENLRREAAARGIDGGRLVFAPRRPPDQHLSRHRLADLFLDTLPYNAHTTACDALWMGLPVVTCAGGAFPGRVAGSVLNAMGLSELVTDRLEDFEKLALELALNPERLHAIRQRVAANRLTTPLFDNARFVRHIEAAYKRMHEAICRGEAPQAFAVEAEKVER